MFAERKGRWNAAERKADWHVQYDDVTNASTHSFVLDPATLSRAPGGVLPPGVYAPTLPCVEAAIPPNFVVVEGGDRHAEGKSKK